MRFLWFLVLFSAIACGNESGTSDSASTGAATGTTAQDGIGATTSTDGTTATNTGSDSTETADGTDGANSTDTTNGLDSSDATDTATETSSTDSTDATDGKIACPPAISDRPAAISEHAGVWDPKKNRMVFFGGNPEFPVECFAKNSYLDQTWAYWPQCGQWELLEGDGPSARGRATPVYNSKHHAMVVFGGRFRPKGANAFTTPYTLYDETWWLDLTTDTWSQITTKGPTPPARVNASSVFDPVGERIVMFGGNASTSGASYLPLNDLYALDVVNDTWSKLKATNSGPSPRLFGATAYDSKRHAMVITMGGDAKAFTGPFLGDTWSLDLDTLTWTFLHKGGDSAAPMRRIWGRTVYSKSLDRIVLFGGHDDGQLGNRNDLWLFDIGAATWESIQLNDSWNKPPNGVCDFPVNFANIVEGTPERRGSHLMVLWEDESKLIVHGGKTDCGQIDDVWTFDLKENTWEDVEPASIGEVCLRVANPDNCNSLCN